MASKTRKVRHELELTGEQKYKYSLQDIEVGLRGVKAATAALNAEYGKNTKSVEGLGKQQEVLTRKLTLQKQKMETIKAEYDKAAAAQGENSKRAQELARDYDYARAAVTRTEKELKALNETTQKATSRIEQFKAKIKEGGGELDKIGGKIAAVGDKMTTFATLPIVAGFTKATKSAIDFGSAVTKLDIITKGELGAARMSKEMLGVSDDLNVAAGKLADARYVAISSGIDMGSSLDYTTGAAKAAIAGYADLSTVLKGSTSIVNAWRMEADQIPGMFDKMILSLDLGRAELEDLASQIGQLTGLAPGLNVSLDDLLAAISALSMTQETSTAINGLKNILSGALKPTKQAQEAAKSLGLEFSATAVKSKGLAAFLQDVVDKTGGSEETFARLFGSVEGLQAALLLTGSAANDFKTNISELGNAAGTVDRVLARLGEDQAYRFSAAWNKMQNATIRFGQTLSPVVEMISAQFDRLTTAMSGLSDGQMQLAAGTLGFVALIGPATSGIGRMVQGFARIKNAIGALAGLVGGAGPLGILLGVVAATTAGVIALKNHIDSLSGVNRLKGTFGAMTIDTAAIDKAVAEAESVEYQLELLANAKFKLSGDSESLQADIVKWLTDGKAETQKEKEEYKKKAGEVLAPVFGAVQEAFAEKKKTLDGQLEAGIIDKATYEARLAELQATTDATKQSLDAESAAYVAYVMTLANAGKKPTEEQLANLEALRQKVVEVGNSILEAQNTALQAAKGSYTRVTHGYGDLGDVSTATKYVQAQADTKIVTAETGYEQAIADLQTKIDNEPDPEIRMGYVLKMEEEREGLERSREAIQLEYSDEMSAIVDGLAKKYPEEMARLRDIAGKQGVVEEIMRAGLTTDMTVLDLIADSVEPMTEAEAASLAQTWMAAFPDVPMPDTVIETKTRLAAELDALKISMDDTAKEIEGYDLLAALSTVIDSGGLEGLDFSWISEDFKAALTTIDLADDGKTVGEQLIKGEVQGITDGEGDLTAAIKASVKAGNDALKAEQGIQSPSTVWEGFGLNMMQGEAQGVKVGGALVYLAIAAHNRKLKQLGADGIQGWIDGAKSKRLQLVQTHAALGRAALLATKGALEISSPSRAFARIGRDSGEGYIIGVNRQVARVRQAHRNLVRLDGLGAQGVPGSTGGDVVPGGLPRSAGQVTSVEYNYYGAITGREAKRAYQASARQLKTASQGKGRW